MKNWKTTLAGILKVAAAALGMIGVAFNPEQQEQIVSAAVIVYTLISAAQAHYTMDKE